MLQDPEMMTLYILGMERLQSIDESDPLSWYQIGGIHGRPYTPYDPAPGSTQRKNGGYCTHSSPLFPVWHRPYLALFEQALAKHVKDIANEYPAAQKQKYVTAAEKFRIPYWDWAYYADPPDVVTKQKEVTLTTPKGQRTLPNPLYQYTFHPKGRRNEFGDNFDDEAKYEAWKSTMRYPTTEGPDATSQGDLIDANLNRQTSRIRSNTYRLLLSAQAEDYRVFSNNRWSGRRTSRDGFQSVEDIHDGIHVEIGQSGHMGNGDFAAFDPMFMIHHANVDRLFAIWQALHPQSYIDNMSRMQQNEAALLSTGLTPFRQSKDAFWTAASARDTRSFNYTYPELEKWASLPPQAKSDRLRTDIMALYGNSVIPRLGEGLFSNARASVPLVSSSAPTTFGIAKMTMEAPQRTMRAPAEVPAAAAASALPEITHYNDWLANILVEKHSAKTSFSIYFFLGDFTNEPAKWSLDPNLVGTYSVFTTNLEMTGCERCRTGAGEGTMVTGTVPLTEALGNRLGKEKLGALEPAEMIPYLTKELHWRIQTAGGRVIERADMPSLKVSITHVPVSLPEKVTDLPTWGESVVHPEITTGRPGGAGADDDDD